ncbi:unnamed protein product [Paramecium primaurelia]|uniref:Transmembrane protein n=1 Tax=Paramecium primaurelia TaxID=5886 RepID=A0A8S1KFQ4_PARPR|nr:unnamed protein product [Paramecium primaurelia]
MYEILKIVDNYISLVLLTFQSQSFYIYNQVNQNYNINIFMIQNEQNWNQLQQQYPQQDDHCELYKLHIKSDLANFYYKIQEKLHQYYEDTFTSFAYFNAIFSIGCSFIIGFYLSKDFCKINILLISLTIQNIYFGSHIKFKLRVILYQNQTYYLGCIQNYGFYFNLFFIRMLIISIFLINQDISYSYFYIIY